MARVEFEQTIRFQHSFTVDADEEDVEDFLDSLGRVDTLDDLSYALVNEFGSDNVSFCEDGSGTEEIELW